MPIKPKLGRKLLLASVGVAAVSYVACSNTDTSGNLIAPPDDASAADANDDFPTSGNLLPPPDANAKDVVDDFVTSGNLIAPPQDAGKDAPSDG